MSTDWNITCVDCASVHGFDDANHQVQLMKLLIEHADAIAALAPLLENNDIELRTLWGRVDAGWFVKHKGHKLVPVDEYGRILQEP